uniref:Tetratricopeptide repeat protein 7 N-terminal domain-containing protein n=1 Tax=Sinocyclocheilus grahami TaxID=75366 RepID=A0A672NF04_SINGR
MTARKSGSRLETEIERCRSEGQWDKIAELVRQMSAKLISNDDLGELLLGEAKLQQYLKENPIKQGASPRGPRPRLQEVRKHLTAALDRGNLKPEYMQEASLIMAKLCYVEVDYREALNQYSRVNLDEMQLVGAPVYRLSMIAEAYATKGLCLEKVPMASPSLSNRNADRDQEIITCYEKSGDIALLYLQEVEKALSVGIQNRSPKPGPVTQDQELGYFLETGLQRAHVIHFKNGNLTRGVSRFREILRAVETRTTQNLRMTIARQLAEILLRGMCEQSYWNPLEDPPHHSPLDDLLRHPLHTKDYALSRRPRIYSGENLFCPQENTEEALLLLLISESMANRDAVLSRIPEHNNDRIISLQSASLVYDLLTIALGRRGQYEMLSECLERAMKFAFEEFHLWFQLALSLMAAGKSARAVKVLKECIRLKPDNPTIPLLAVKLCIGNLHWLEEGERFAKIVIDMGEKAAEFRAKGYLAIGLVYSLKATDASLRGMQEEYQKKALILYLKCRAEEIKTDLSLSVFNKRFSLFIKYLIRHSDGRRVIINTFFCLCSLLFTKVKLETLCRGPEDALLSCKRMLQIWKSCYNLTNPSDSGRGSSLLDRAVADRRQLNAMTLPDFSDPETGSVHATSIAASRVEQALSEVASSLQSSLHGELIKIITVERQMAFLQVIFRRGNYILNFLASVVFFTNNSFPFSLLICLSLSVFLQGLILHQLQRYSLAEKILRDAVQVNSTAHDVWNSLGEVLQAQGNDAAATECFLTALELEASCPILPFTIIPRTL